MQTEPDEEWELIPDDEPPLTVREWDHLLAGKMSRTERRRAWRAISEAGLILFRE